MRVRKFEGATMRDAIAKVKTELGEDAVIISTRQVRRGLLGTGVEISAATDDDVEPRADGPSIGGPGLPPRTEHDVEKLLAPLRSELKSLRALVRSSGEGRATTEMRAELAALRKLIEGMHAPPEPAARTPGPATFPGRSHELSLTAESAGRVVMLVGPTGAGKTTTIAKLAARAALIEGRRVNLITLDNYRVGGIDQIRTFADLIGIPLRVSHDLATLRDLIDDDDELTLIDTAGRSPRDSASIHELAEVLPSLPPIEVHLVIPAVTTPGAIDELARRYRPLSPARLLFTKLDEADLVPELVHAPARTALPVTWITTGQAVPEDLETPTTTRLLELASSGLSCAPTTPTRHRGHRAA